MVRLPSGTTPFMQRPTQRADILGLGKTPKRLLKVSGKHFGSQKQANIRNITINIHAEWRYPRSDPHLHCSGGRRKFFGRRPASEARAVRRQPDAREFGRTARCEALRS